MAVVRREESWCQVEGIVNFGPNLEIFLLMLGLQIGYVVGAYFPPNNTSDVYHVEQALEAVPKVMELILLGDLNPQLHEPRDAREEDLAIALADIGMVDMTYHFIPRRRYR